MRKRCSQSKEAEVYEFVKLHLPRNDTEVRRSSHSVGEHRRGVTAATVRQKKVDTSAPLEIGMAAKDDRESSREEGEKRIMDIALQVVHKGTGEGNWREPGRVRVGSPRMQIVEERVHGREATARLEAKEQRKVVRVTAGLAGHLSKQDTLQPRVQNAAT